MLHVLSSHPGTNQRRYRKKWLVASSAGGLGIRHEAKGPAKFDLPNQFKPSQLNKRPLFTAQIKRSIAFSITSVREHLRQTDSSNTSETGLHAVKLNLRHRSSQTY